MKSLIIGGSNQESLKITRTLPLIPFLRIVDIYI